MDSIGTVYLSEIIFINYTTNNKYNLKTFIDSISTLILFTTPLCNINLLQFLIIHYHHILYRLALILRFALFCLHDILVFCLSH